MRHLVLLIVEDDYLVAGSLQWTLEEDYGATVVGPHPSVATAIAAIKSGTSLDAAILDVNLGREQSFPVADELIRRGVPFVLVTGYDTHTLPRDYRDCAVLQKPVTVPAILKRLQLAGLRLNEI